MKKSIEILLLISLLIISSCSHPIIHTPEAMTQAKQIIDESPDSALQLLTHYKDSVTQQPESVQMYYLLLTAEAQNKCHIPAKNDSAMLKVVSFYEDYDDNNKLMAAYFYLGCTYIDLKEGFRAWDYFQKAVNISDKSTDYKMQGGIYNKIGAMFLEQQVYSMVMHSYKKAYHYYQLSKDSLMFPYALRGIGRAYDAFGQPDSAIFYYQKGFEIATITQNRLSKNVILNDLADVYIRKQSYDLAKKALRISSTQAEEGNNQAVHYATWGSLYNQTGNADSAIYYYSKAVQTGDLKIREKCFRKLSDIEKSKGNYREATNYIYHYLNCADSILEQSYQEGMNKIETFYSYHRTLKENIRLQQVNLMQKLGLITLGFVIVVCCMLYYMQQNRRKKQSLIEQEKRLAYMHKLLEKTKEQEDSDAYIKKEDILKQSDIYLRFHDATTGSAKVNESDWEELRKTIDITYDDFTHRLYILCPSITLIELRICYLIKISINVTGIAQLINRSKSSVSTARSQLYKKIHQKEGTPGMLDAFIADL